MAIVLLTYINTRGVKEGAAVNNTFTVLKFATVLYVLALYLTYRFQDDYVDNYSAGMTKEAEGLAGMSTALIAVMWAFDGWNSLNFMMGELKEPSQLPSICIAGVSTVCAIYFLMNYSYLCVLPTDTVATSKTIGTDYAQAVAGDAGRYIIAAAIACSALGSVNGSVMGGGRVIYAAALDGYVPKRFGAVDKETATPNLALWVQAAWSSVLLLPGSVGDLINLFGVASWLFYGMAAVAVILLRHLEPDAERSYKVIGYPFTPAVLALVSAYLVLDSIREAPWTSITALVASALPVPAYFIMETYYPTDPGDVATELEFAGQTPTLTLNHPTCPKLS